MDEMRNGIIGENWSQSVLELAKHSSLSFSLSGWLAAATLISIPTSIILFYAIKAFATRV